MQIRLYGTGHKDLGTASIQDAREFPPFVSLPPSEDGAVRIFKQRINGYYDEITDLIAPAIQLVTPRKV